MTMLRTRFEVHVSDEVLADLRTRLARVRWPDEAPDNHWKYGTERSYLKSLVEYWRDHYQWRVHEAHLNRFAQFKVQLAGIDLHFIHEEGQGPAPKPLLISHGWPGSVYEFHRLIPMLTDPARFGGDPADAFTVIAPSLPGYTFSFTPNQPRFSIEQMADVFAELMTDVLGYRRFAAQGGDWGAFITSRLGYRYPERLTGIHLNSMALRRDTPAPERPTDDEQLYFEQRAQWMKEETGYAWIQGTKPQTLAYALNDSPVGLAAWIVEKFHSWSDNEGDLDKYIGRDAMLTNIMLYWVTGAIGASFAPYYARLHGPWPIPDDAAIAVPMGFAEFPKEMLRPPRSLAHPMYADIRRWTKMAKGGHFAALEQPELLAQEIREFFRPLR
ncbi:MAG TPA: epoxide hydrolase [Burkholderiaceae bacterium]|nr:epoxide hydrolase [Burkholderiaceae bacterium]